MLFLQGITYAHPNRDVLFADISLAVNKHDKTVLIGNNGTGKSTLLKILAGELFPSQGLVRADSVPYYVPQVVGQFNDYSIARALGIENKINALRQILSGDVTERNLAMLDEDWNIEERCQQAFAFWGLNQLALTESMGRLSGGQKTKVFLSGIQIHQPQIVLLDEPSNHLDTTGRKLLYDYVSSTSDTLLVVSHDVSLLNLLSTVYELKKGGIAIYGGNYDFYTEQKKIEIDALNHDLMAKEKALRKAKETEKEALERQHKLDARGKRKQEKAGLPTISMKTFKNNAEKSTARIKGVHDEKVGGLSQDVSKLRGELSGVSQMKIDFDNSSLYNGKLLVEASGLNYGYRNEPLWKTDLNFQILSGERIVINGLNGSGKSTLIKLVLDELENQAGTIRRANFSSVYIDQDYSLINDELTVYQQAQLYNSGVLQEHDIKIRLNRFLFTKPYWDKACRALSGGEKMRLTLCALAIKNQAPDMIVLDEPTNNLDIQNLEILTDAINEYKGTLLVVSHDAYFISQINVERMISLD